MSESFNKAVEVTREIVRWRVSPYKCLYHNPSKYSIVEFARWTQKYLNCKIYLTLLEAAKITGYEPVPSHLLNHNATRDGYAGRKIKIGRINFYLLRLDEMTKGLRLSYNEFRKTVLKN